MRRTSKTTDDVPDQIQDLLDRQHANSRRTPDSMYADMTGPKTRTKNNEPDSPRKSILKTNKSFSVDLLNQSLGSIDDDVSSTSSKKDPVSSSRSSRVIVKPPKPAAAKERSRSTPRTFFGRSKKVSSGVF